MDELAEPLLRMGEEK